MAHLIDKDAVISVIDKKLSYYKDLESRGLLSKEGDAAYRVVRILKSDINSLELKEVNLETELKQWWNNHYSKSYPFDAYAGHYIENSTVIEIAKYFFELGLKAQKGESLQEVPCNNCQGFNNKEKCDELVFTHNCPVVKKPISIDLEEAAENHAIERYRATRDMVLAEKCKWSFKEGANWKREQIAKENMLLPFKEYDNLMESINKRKKEGYEAGYKQGLVDSKSE